MYAACMQQIVAHACTVPQRSHGKITRPLSAVRLSGALLRRTPCCACPVLADGRTVDSDMHAVANGAIRTAFPISQHGLMANALLVCPNGFHQRPRSCSAALEHHA
jgi:hypothetical protein